MKKNLFIYFFLVAKKACNKREMNGHRHFPSDDNHNSGSRVIRACTDTTQIPHW